jgi:hypothetical protein
MESLAGCPKALNKSARSIVLRLKPSVFVIPILQYYDNYKFFDL